MFPNLWLFMLLAARWPISFLLAALRGSVPNRAVEFRVLRRIKASRRRAGAGIIQPLLTRYLMKYCRSKFFM